MDFPKIEVVVESSVTYQNLSAEKYKTNGKRINSIRLTQKEKSPKNHPKLPRMVLWMVFGMVWDGKLQNATGREGKF